MASIQANFKNGTVVSFKFRAFLERDKNGKQIVRCTTWKPDKDMSEKRLYKKAEEEAAIWEHQILEQYENEKNMFKPSAILFEDFVERIWMPSQSAERGCRATTIEFRGYMLKVILPYLGKTKLSDISDRTVQMYMDYLKNTYRTPQNRHVSQQTMKHHYSTLNLIFAHAVKLGYIEQNPMSKVEAPKLTRHKVDALTRGEVSTFIREIENLPLSQQTMYTLLLTTGLRRGELFGLQWKDVDFSNKLLHVERNVTYTSLSGVVVGLPKTETGIRVVPLTERALTLLEEYKQSEAPLDEKAYLFHAVDNPTIPRDPTYLTKHMKKFMKRVGLPDMSPHDLRHTCASIMLQSGADIKSVQDMLGHADASTTLNFYAVSNIDNMRESARRAFE